MEGKPAMETIMRELRVRTPEERGKGKRRKSWKGDMGRNIFPGKRKKNKEESASGKDISNSFLGGKNIKIFSLGFKNPLKGCRLK